MKNRIVVVSLALFALLGLTVQPVAAESLDKDWPHKQKITVDTTASGTELKEVASQVPLAIRLHTGNFNFAEAKPDGSDLRVAAADGKTPLHFHIEKFDAINELAVLWVQVPKLAPNLKSVPVILYWGNQGAEAASDAKGSYDGTQALVLHFGEQDTPKDSTGLANNPREANAVLGAAGPLGTAATFDGNKKITIPASPSLKLVPANGVTFSAWVKPADQQDGVLFEQREGAKSLVVGLVEGVVSVKVDGKETKASVPLQAGVWQHMAATMGGGKLAIYVNGAAVGAADVALPDLGGEIVIGAGFRGDLDEVTLATVARSAEYIKALYAGQQPDGLLMSFAEGEGESEGGDEASYMGILLGALTVDGWVVVGILVVMAFISVGVMVGKTLFLNKAKKANTVFLDLFKDNPVALLTPGTPEVNSMLNNEAVKHSPIYRLYAIGLREVQHRFEMQDSTGTPHNLSGAALDSIRASMDAGMVRENQRLNSQIVLLTIAISGGPFLGLLGTVVGVMITFAAIAAAGDVNVNSIAPGIAAALVATVAGLAVAIPALFAYNWLAIQIKNVASDTQVFADEFITKTAELYSV